MAKKFMLLAKKIMLRPRKFNAELAEQVRAEKCRDASEKMAELEQKRLNAIFSTLGDIDTQYSLRAFLDFSQDKFSTLSEIRNAVEAGDRKAMMILLDVVMDSLRNFEVLPQDVRDALANSIDKMREKSADAEASLILETLDKYKIDSATNAANARHSKEGGSRDLKKKIRAIWATGKYSDRNRCADEEWVDLGFKSPKTARNALLNTPTPPPRPAKKKPSKS